MVVVVVVVCVCGGGGEGAARRRARGATAEGRKRGNLGRFVLRGKAYPFGVYTKELSRQGRGRDILRRLRRRRRLGRSPSGRQQLRCACRGFRATGRAQHASPLSARSDGLHRYGGHGGDGTADEAHSTSRCLPVHLGEGRGLRVHEICIWCKHAHVLTVVVRDRGDLNEFDNSRQARH